MYIIVYIYPLYACFSVYVFIYCTEYAAYVLLVYACSYLCYMTLIRSHTIYMYILSCIYSHIPIYTCIYRLSESKAKLSLNLDENEELITEYKNKIKDTQNKYNNIKNDLDDEKLKYYNSITTNDKERNILIKTYTDKEDSYIHKITEIKAELKTILAENDVVQLAYEHLKKVLSSLEYDNKRLIEDNKHLKSEVKRLQFLGNQGELGQRAAVPSSPLSPSADSYERSEAVPIINTAHSTSITSNSAETKEGEHDGSNSYSNMVSEFEATVRALKQEKSDLLQQLAVALVANPPAAGPSFPPPRTDLNTPKPAVSPVPVQSETLSPDARAVDKVEDVAKADISVHVGLILSLRQQLHSSNDKVAALESQVFIASIV